MTEWSSRARHARETAPTYPNPKILIFIDYSLFLSMRKAGDIEQEPCSCVPRHGRISLLQRAKANLLERLGSPARGHVLLDIFPCFLGETRAALAVIEQRDYGTSQGLARVGFKIVPIALDGQALDTYSRRYDGT